MLKYKLFDGRENELTVYNGQAIINMEVEFFTEECDNDLEVEEVDFDFPGYVSSYLRVFNERGGRELKDIVLSQSGLTLIINASVLEMTFQDNGNYYYEIGYVMSGYEQALIYGKLKVK